MAGSLNKVMIIGNLGKDPEVRLLNSGLPVVNFSVATSETWKDKATGERKDKTEWHNVVVFNEGLAKIAEQYLKKGSKVYIEGKLQTRKWQDRSGADRYTTEIVLPNFSGAIVLLGDKPGGDDQTKATPARANAYAEASGGTARQPSYAEELDDEIPF